MLKSLALLLTIFVTHAAFADGKPMADTDVKVSVISYFNGNLREKNPTRTQQGTPEINVKLSVCSLSTLMNPQLVRTHTNFSKCSDLARINSVNGKSPRPVTFSALGFFKNASDSNIQLGDAVLMVSMWMTEPGQGNDIYLSHGILNLLKLNATEDYGLSLLENSSNAAVTLKLNFKPTPIDPEFADLNPPFELYDPVVVSSLLKKKLEDVTLGDYMFATILYYQDSQNPLWSDLSKGIDVNPSNADHAKIIKNAQDLLNGTSLERGLRIYQINYQHKWALAQARIAKKQAALQAQQAKLREEAEAQQRQAQEEQRQAELQKKQAEFYKQQAAWAKQQREIQDAKIGWAVGQLLGGAAAQGVNHVLR